MGQIGCYPENHTSLQFVLFLWDQIVKQKHLKAIHIYRNKYIFLKSCRNNIGVLICL